MVHVRTGEPENAELGDQQMAYFAVSRHQSRSAKEGAAARSGRCARPGRMQG